MRPRARQDGILVQELPEETLVYDLDRHEAHCLGPLVARIWRRCDGRTSVPEIARSLRGETGAAVDEGVVWPALRRLARAHLLESEPRAPEGLPSRREWLKRAAVLGGLSVLSIAAPRAVEAATCIPPGGNCLGGGVCCPPAVCGCRTRNRCGLPNGSPCSRNSDCCSGDCERGVCD